MNDALVKYDKDHSIDNLEYVEPTKIFIPKNEYDCLKQYLKRRIQFCLKKRLLIIKFRFSNYIFISY